jgi:hypothetical protein
MVIVSLSGLLRSDEGVIGRERSGTAGLGFKIFVNDQRCRPGAWTRSYRLALAAMILASSAAARAEQVLSSQAQPIGSSRTLLKTTARSPGSTLVLADGAVQPGGGALVELWLEVDGASVGSRAVLDWRGSHHPATHGFRLLAGPTLALGTHRLALMGRAQGGASMLPGAGLTVLGVPGLRGAQSTAVVAVQTGTPALRNGDRLALMDVVGISTARLRGPVVVMAAGTAAHVAGGSYGDAMWSLLLDGRELAANEGSYADNDICQCAEVQAPLALQGLIAPGGRVSLGAGAEPWPGKLGADEVRYRVPAGATVVALGDLAGAGSLTLLPAAQGEGVYRFPYRCIASSHGWAKRRRPFRRTRRRWFRRRCGCRETGTTVAAGSRCGLRWTANGSARQRCRTWWRRLR